MTSFSSNVGPARSFYLVLALVIVSAIIPFRIGGWLQDPTDALHNLVVAVVVPLSDPLVRVGTLLRPARRNFADDDRDLDRVLLELRQAEARIRFLEAHSTDLLRQIEEFQRGYAADMQNQYRLLKARRVAITGGSGSRVFTINAGSRQPGIEVDIVAVAGVYHLVGRISRVGLLTSTVTPVTTPASGPVRVTVKAPAMSMEGGVIGTLRPVGDGSLIGEFPVDRQIRPGDQAVLNDPAWGEGHTGLLVGLVSATRPYDANPLFHQIIVKPEFEIQRVAEVMLRIPRSALDDDDRSSPTSGRGG